MFNKNLTLFFDKHVESIAFILTFLFVAKYILLGSCHLPANSGGADAQVFATIGYSWLQGLIPYKDLFDHKGPFLYLINAIGFIIGRNNEFGIFIVELLFCILWIRLIFNLFENVYISCISVIVVVFSIYSISYEGGNLTEEYAILFSLLSIYIYLKNPYSSNINFFILGICGGINAMLRVNLAITPFILFVFLVFSKKDFKEAVLSIVWCTFGFIVSVLPFILYFLYNNALYEFYISYIKFNFFYVTEFRSMYGVLGAFLKFKLFSIFAIFLIFYSLYKKLYLSFLLFVSCMIFGIFLSMRAYPHYFSILIPPSIFFIYSVEKNINDTISRFSNVIQKKYGKSKFYFIRNALIIAVILILIPYNITNVMSRDNLNNEILYLKKLGINDSSRILVLSHNLTAIHHLVKSPPQQRVFFTTGSVKYENNEFNYGITPVSEFSQKFDFIISHKPDDIAGFEKCGVFRRGTIFRNEKVDNNVIFNDDISVLTNLESMNSSEEKTAMTEMGKFNFLFNKERKLLIVYVENKIYDKNISLYVKPKVSSIKEYIRKIIRYLDNAGNYPEIASSDMIGYAYKRVDGLSVNIPNMFNVNINNLNDIIYLGLYDEEKKFNFYKLKWQ